MGNRAAAATLTLVPALALWAVAAAALARITTRVVDWYVMTDELYYERLALAVARTASPLPRLHGELVPNVNQLYPVAIAPLLRGELIPAAVHDVRVLNAILFSSAVVPAFLLARRVAGPWLALGVAALTVAVPWAVYATMLLTEVVAYPAFLWAVLAIQAATARPRPLGDALALAGIAVATLARTQLVVLALVLPLAVLAHRRSPREALARHRVLAAAYALGTLAALALLATGNAGRVLGTYRSAATGDLLPDGTTWSLAEHAAALALASGLLPFLVGTAWAITRVGRGDGERAAFAALALATTGLLLLEVTSFDLRYAGGLVSDRYLFYALPVVLAAAAAAVGDPPWPRLSLLVPATVAAIGFSGIDVPRSDKLSFDRPLAVAVEWVADAGGSDAGGRATLVLATVVAALLFAQAASRLGRVPVAAVVAACALVAVPATAAGVFVRLFSVDGTSGRPVTLDQGGVFNWIDRTIGPEEDVTMLPFPLHPGDYWAGVAFWWDLEFWNASVTRAATLRDRFVTTPRSFPQLELRFDRRTGAVNVSPTRYVVQALADTRFRIAGRRIEEQRGLRLAEPERPWRAEWIGAGLWDDGWTRAGEPATFRVYAPPGQVTALTRYLAVRLRAAPGSPPQRYRVSADGNVASGTVGDDTVDVQVPVCVPVLGGAPVLLRVEGDVPIPPDPTSLATFAEPRRGGAQVVDVALADEVGGACAVAR